MIRSIRLGRIPILIKERDYASFEPTWGLKLLLRINQHRKFAARAHSNFLSTTAKSPLSDPLHHQNNMAILLAGGSGRIGSATAQFLQEEGIPFLIASRNAEETAPQGMPAIKFDYEDPATFSKPFEHQFLGGENFTAAFLVMPNIPEPAGPTIQFVNYAFKEHGVKRFVLVGPFTLRKGGPYGGEVWQHLVDIGADYTIIRPSWTMDLFIQPEVHLTNITKDSDVISATGDGKIPFVRVRDIAAVAFRALIDEKPHNTDYRVTGPELITHDEIAENFTKLLGRNVRHLRIDGERKGVMMREFGLPEHYVQAIVRQEVAAGEKLEEKVEDTVEKVTGQRPQSFDSFMEEHKSVWH